MVWNNYVQKNNKEEELGKAVFRHFSFFGVCSNKLLLHEFHAKHKIKAHISG